jgi:hypothetical protein
MPKKKDLEKSNSGRKYLNGEPVGKNLGEGNVGDSTGKKGNVGDRVYKRKVGKNGGKTLGEGTVGYSVGKNFHKSIIDSAPKVLIIIVNFNGVDLLRTHLPSVAATDYTNLDILVVDNGSTDHSLKYLKDKFPDIEILQLNQNYGFGKANNLAFKKYPDYDYYALLNNDMSVPPTWLKELIKKAESEKQIAAVGPKILYGKKSDGQDVINSAGMIIDKHYRGFDRYQGLNDSKKYDLTEKVDGLSGGALLIRQKALKDVTGFDERMFFYYEDVDLSLRLRDNGWKLIYHGKVEVFHDHQATSNKTQSKFMRNYRANLNRIKSIETRLGTIAALKEGLRTFFEWLWCKVSGTSLQQKVLEDAQKKADQS